MPEVIAVVQARMSSSRLPGKVLKPIANGSVLSTLLARLSRSALISKIIVATTNQADDNDVAELCKELGVECFRGEVDDVLGRFHKALLDHHPDYVARVTADCPLVDPMLVDSTIKMVLDQNLDYGSNCNPATFPDGFDVEVFTIESLRQANLLATSRFDREHVTPWIRANVTKVGNYEADTDSSHLRVTVDESPDLDLVRLICEALGPDATWQQIVEYLSSNPQLTKLNSHLKRNEGSTLGRGQKLWRHAKKVIPGGNMLLSKRPEMFLPEKWPAYFESASGCEVTDLDGNTFIDMSIMGIGTNTLGYGNVVVDEAVNQVIRKGNMSSLNAPEEVWLADALLQINPWASMVRFARTGGEANAVAIRIARAAAGRNNIAICGYHGWHDWYLSANLAGDKNLDGHLLPGLETRGVPRELLGTVHTFQYNKFEELCEVVATKSIGVIVMEVSRNFGPENGFLRKVRDLASAKGIVLIFDECTSGFRETFGGLHLKYDVEPDIAMYGKALGNGYAITAVVGRQEVMEAAQASFISSTFWTERIGPAAALATLKEMQSQESWNRISELGRYMRAGIDDLASSTGLNLSHWGIDALSGYTVQCADPLVAKTLVTQEMLKLGYLAGNSFYASTAHDEQTIDVYLQRLEAVFKLVSKFQTDSNALMSLLEGPVAHSGFQRLN